jgi:hypothetical protein
MCEQNDAMAAWAEEDRKQKELDAAVLEQVRAMVTQEAFADIQAYIAEAGYTYDYKLATEPRGEQQCEKWAFGDPYVNQTTNGGYSGDEYAGTVSIPLGDGKFFQFSYSM